MGTTNNEKLFDIAEELARLSAQHAAVADELRSAFEHLDKKITAIQTKLDGNGSAGLLLRVDRLEQSEQRRSRLTWIAVTSSVGAIIALVFKLLH